MEGGEKKRTSETKGSKRNKKRQREGIETKKTESDRKKKTVKKDGKWIERRGKGKQKRNANIWLI